MGESVCIARIAAAASKPVTSADSVPADVASSACGRIHKRIKRALLILRDLLFSARRRTIAKNQG